SGAVELAYELRDAFQLFESGDHADRLVGADARHEAAAIAEFIGQFVPAHRLFRVAARDVGAALDGPAVFEFYPHARAHLIVAERFELGVDRERHALHEIDDTRIAHLAVGELGDARFALDNGDRHAERN